MRITSYSPGIKHVGKGVPLFRVLNLRSFHGEDTSEYDEAYLYTYTHLCPSTLSYTTYPLTKSLT